MRTTILIRSEMEKPDPEPYPELLVPGFGRMDWKRKQNLLWDYTEAAIEIHCFGL